MGGSDFNLTGGLWEALTSMGVKSGLKRFTHMGPNPAIYNAQLDQSPAPVCSPVVAHVSAEVLPGAPGGCVVQGASSWLAVPANIKGVYPGATTGRCRLLPPSPSHLRSLPRRLSWPQKNPLVATCEKCWFRDTWNMGLHPWTFWLVAHWWMFYITISN